MSEAEWMQGAAPSEERGVRGHAAATRGAGDAADARRGPYSRTLLELPPRLVSRLVWWLVVAGALTACDGPPGTERHRAARPPAPGHATPVAPDAHGGPDAPDVRGEADTSADTHTRVDAFELDTITDILADGDTIPSSDAPTDTSPDSSDDATSGAHDVTDDATSGAHDATAAPPDSANPPTGTPTDPITVTRFPFVVDDDTTTSPSDLLDRYACAAGTDESGPERVYVFDLIAAGELVAEVDEADGVDVDLHLLAADPATAPPTAVPCLSRANTRLEADLAPGRYWLVVDTYVAASGDKPGAYRVALEHTVLDAWQTHLVAPGVLWKKKVYADYAGGRQTINALDVDLADPAVSIRPHGGDGCIRPSRVGPAEGAIAAVNAGFFDTGPGTCPPLDLIKIEGELVSTNRLTGAAQRSIGVDTEGRALIDWVAAGEDWPAAWSAIGSYPSLVTDGAIRLEPDKDSDFFDGRHPRTALGLTADGHLLIVTVDGRTSAGRGMTLHQLAQHLLNLGAVHAVNLDGGGSTAMWIDGQSINGVVSHPSDNGSADHFGERAVSDVLLVFSEP